jgi:hypothetical protein
MKWFPFDSQRLEIVFEVPGFDRDEIVLESAPTAAGEVLASTVRIPQWTITGAGTSVRDGSLSYAAHVPFSSGSAAGRRPGARATVTCEFRRHTGDE